MYAFPTPYFFHFKLPSVENRKRVIKIREGQRKRSVFGVGEKFLLVKLVEVDAFVIVHNTQKRF